MLEVADMSRTQLKPFYNLKQDFENQRSKDFYREMLLFDWLFWFKGFLVVSVTGMSFWFGILVLQ